MKNIEKLYDIFRSSTGVMTDTRDIRQGCLFFCLRGQRFDANEMVGEALQRGALHVVTSNSQWAADPRVTIVDDTLFTLQQLALHHRRELQIPVVGLTGTNGKTTTKELLTAVLSTRYQTAATVGNHNNHIGVPLTVLSITPQDQMAVIEMGANHPGEIRTLCNIALPTAGLVTNVGIAHLEGFGSFEGVKETKKELYDYLEGSGRTIFCDPSNSHLREMIGTVYPDVVYYVGGEALPSSDGKLRLRTKGRIAHTKLIGDYNLANALAAITVGRYYGISTDDAIRAIENYTPTNGRSQLTTTDRNTLIVDAYNANLTSMNAALDNFARIETNHKVVILGAMRELGTETNNAHKQILQKVAELRPDVAILIGEEFRPFEKQYPQFTFAEQTNQVVDLCLGLSGKSILIKGSNSNHLQALVEYL